MKNITNIIIIVTLLMIMVSFSYSLPYVTLTINGRVSDDFGNNLDGATILLHTPSGCYLASGSNTTTSDSDAYYEIDATYICTNFPVTFVMNATYNNAYETKTLDPISEPGQYYYSKDFELDVTPPTISFSPNSNNWDNQITVNISASDHSNVQGIYYKVISSSSSCPSMGYSFASGNYKLVTISNNGNWKICAYGVDQFDNEGYPISSGTYHIDTQTPTISTTITNGIKYSTYYCVKSSVSASYTAEDSESGLENIAYNLGGSSIYNKDLSGQNSFSDSFSFSIASDKNLNGIATDRAGNTYSNIISLKLDNHGPNKVTITSYPQYVKSNENYKIQWDSVSDVGCAGLDNYKIKIKDPNGNIQTYTTSNTQFTFNANKDGKYTFSIAGVDKLGNIGAWNSVDIISDSVNPTVSFNPNSHSWTNSNIQVTISASDSGSGINKLYYKTINHNQNCPSVGDSSYNSISGNSKSITISSNGQWKICAYAKDNSGNVPSSASQSGIYKLDKTNPTININSPKDGVYINSTSVTVTWSGSDSLSGISNYKYKLDNGNWINVGSSTSHAFNLKDGKHTVYVKAIDKAGNSKSTSVQFTIDTIAPTILFNPNNSDWTKQKLVTIQFSDTNNIVEKKYKVIISSDNCGTDLSTYNNYNSEILLNQNGQWKICAYAKDIAGNFKFSNSGIYKIDNQKPFVGDAKSNLPFYNGYYYSKPGLNVKTFAKANDSLSGIYKCYYTTKDKQIEGTFNGSYCKYDFVEPTNAVDTTFWFVAVDNAGNQNNGGSATIKIDKQSPIVSISAKKYWNTLPISIHYDMSDNVLITKYDVTIDSTTNSYNYYGQSNSGDYKINSISNGNHTIEFKVYDIVNNTKSNSLSFCFDNETPSLTLENPVINGKTVEFTWNTNDNGCSGVNHSELYVDTHLVYSGSNKEYTTNLNPGDHTWKVIVYDNANNSIEKSSTLHIDNQAPNVNLISPVEKYLNTNSITLKFNVTDDSSNELNCTLFINNVEEWNGLVPNNTEKDIQVSKNDGDYTWKVKCIDDAGNEKDISSWFVIDTKKPSIDIISPNSNSYLNNTNIEVKISANDENYDHTVISILNGTHVIDSVTTNQHGIITIDLDSKDDGIYSIIAKTFDKAGNVNSDEKDNIIIDTIAPNTQINTTKSDGAQYNYDWTNQSIFVEFSVKDENPDKTYYKIDNGAWNIYNNKFEISTDGNHTLEYYSIDKAGNKENTNKVYIKIDKDIPTVSFNPDSQDNWTNNNLNVNITGKDKTSGVKGIYYLIISPNQNCPAVGDSSYIYSNNPTSVTIDSDSKICAYAVDNAGNVGDKNSSEEYKIDKISPTVNIINPVNNTYTNNNDISINWDGNDNVKIVDYKIDIDGNIIDVGTNTSYQKTLSDGTHKIKVIATDEANNQNDSEVTIYIDNTPPSIKITSPDNNSIHSGNTITVSWNSNDNLKLDHFDIYLNGNLIGSTNKTSKELDNLNDGKYIVEVVAFDKAGNSNESEITFYIDNTPPKIGFISPLDWTNENPTIVFNVTDIEPMIKCVVKMDGNEIYNKTSNPGKIEIPLSNVVGGNHSLDIICSDKFYKSNITQTIKVDNNTPTLNIISPSNGARIPKGSFVITIKANDSYSGIKNVTVIFGNKKYNAIYDGTNYKLTLNPTTTGTKSIVIKAVDKVGHQTSKGININVYTPSTGGGYIGGGTGCTVVGYKCNANSDCCSGYCNAGVCANHPKDVKLNIKITPTSWEMYDNDTATFTILVENNGKDSANGILLSLSGVNGTINEPKFDLSGKSSKIIFLNVKEGLGEYTGKVSAKWENISDSASFSLKVLNHNIPVESKLASDICSNASAHIVSLASTGMNVSNLYDKYNKALEEIKNGNYSNARTICQGIINTKQNIKPPTKVTPFFIKVGNGIKDNWAYVSTVTGLIAGIAIWIKREAIIRWYELKRLH